MKKVYFLILGLVIFSCQKEKKNPENVTEEITEEITEEVTKGEHIRNFVSNGENYSQELILKWTNEDKATYSLSFQNENCEMEISGTGISNPQQTTNEQYKASRKKGYITFIDQKKDFTVIIHLAAEDKDSGIATLIYSDPEKDCRPFSNPMFETATE